VVCKIKISLFTILAGVENIADHGTSGPRKFSLLAERKKGRKKSGKERKEGKETKKEGKKKNRKKERVTAPINSHFVQGQTLGVGGAPKIVPERTLIAAGC
jgi:DNA invertase Pin-like site-specific DNA recombinase